ncbi:MAG: efflux RND transporter permease subunit, partial [Candidatus Latescibacteria bacterium]|nr:efflux RND transporter permease subunit [Candidatus Latescibacterota bacterium]
MKLTRVAIDNYRLTIIQYAAFLILGLGAISTMPYSEDPPLDPAGSSIIVYYPGTSPVDLERQVVEPLEEAVNEIEDIKHISARIEDGTTKISVEFETYADADDKYREVREQVNKVRDRLPPNIAALDIIQWSTSNTRIMQMALTDDNATYHELYDEALHIKRNLERVPNVKQIGILGDPDEIVEINLDLERLGHYGLGIPHIIQAIKTHNTAIPGGSISVGSKRFTIKTSGSYINLNDIRRTVLRTQQGTVLYLSDIATVKFGYREHLYKTRFNGKRCLFIAVKQKKGSDIFLIVQTIRDRAEILQKEMPPGMQLSIGFDQAQSVASRIQTFSGSLGQGILLVGIVIFLVVGARASFIVMIAIPASFIIGLACVYLTGFGIHQITIIGFIIALGLLVDNAIVVVESVVRYQREGNTGRDAAIKGVNLIALPIASSTLTTVLAFVPIIFLGGSTGDFIRSLPITVIYTLTASLFVALTLTPLLASRLMSKSYKEPATHRLMEHFVTHQYQPVLHWCLNHYIITLMLTGIIFIASLSLFPLVGVSFFPKAEKPIIMIDIDMPRGTDLPTTDAVVKQIEEALLTQQEFVNIMANVGRGNPQVYYNMNLTENKPHVGQIFTIVDPKKGRTVAQIIDDLRTQFATFPTGRIRVWEFKQGPSSDPPIYIRIQGDNLETLSGLAKDVEDIMQ